MEKRFGSPKRQDGLMKVGRNKYDLFFGFGKENEEDASGWNYYHRFTHRPTLDEIKEVITAQIDNDTDMKILTQFSWNGKAVYLSKENQMNFKAAYDLAVQTNGQSLPIKFKLGEDADKNAVYHTFSELAEFSDFYTKAISFVVTCLNEGWEVKDSINYENLIANE